MVLLKDANSSLRKTGSIVSERGKKYFEKTRSFHS